MKTTDINILQSEYSKEMKTWKHIYQWKRVKSKGNIEIISEMLLKDFDKTIWSDRGLRTKDFNIQSHKGLCQIQTPITQFTEKRFCRALFNEFNNNDHPLLGKIFDYETPLTEPNQKQNKINQGDIDLVSRRDNDLLFIEVKKASNFEEK